MIGTSLLSRHICRSTTKLVNANQISALKAMATKITFPNTVVPHRSFSSQLRVSIDEAKKMPKHYNEMPNGVLLTMAASGDQQAREERVIREIMCVDGTEWPVARTTFYKILTANRSDSVLMFNDYFVTTDVPDDKDLETALEVGSWAWNWMEPPLGQISFFLLCMQYARAQLENLGAKPYTAAYKARRAARLCKQFPMYDGHILTSFSEGDCFTPDDFDAIH